MISEVVGLLSHPKRVIASFLSLNAGLKKEKKNRKRIEIAFNF